MSIDTAFLRRCIRSLELALSEIGKHQEGGDFLYDIYRAACVKEFELILEQSGKLPRKRLAGCKLESRKRQELLRMTLNGFGVRMDGKTLQVHASPGDFALKKHNLLQVSQEGMGPRGEVQRWVIGGVHAVRQPKDGRAGKLESRIGHLAAFNTSLKLCPRWRMASRSRRSVSGSSVTVVRMEAP